ncbi:MAG: hypothetical protein ACFE0I_13465 [Elainellaceae cyanobacterium]
MAQDDSHPYQHFNLKFVAIALFTLFAAGLVNAAIDPYGVINVPIRSQINQLKPQQFNNVRLFKAAGIIHHRPDVVLLGSSRADLGLDPQHPALGSARQAYNLGLVGPNMHEVRRYLDHAIANQPDLKTVVLGIDFFMFNDYKQDESDFVDSRLGRHHLSIQDLLNVTLSVDALTSSYQTVRASLKSDAYYLYRDDGMRYIYQDEPKGSAEDRFKESMQGYLNTEGYYKRYARSDEQLLHLKAVVDLCRDRGIELKIFISPSHATQWETLHDAGLWEQFEDWKRDVVQMTPVWDFSGYTTVTTEPISDHMHYYWDSSHYRDKTGDLVIDRLFGDPDMNVPPDFGVWVTPDTIDTHLAQNRRDRQVWVSQNPDDLKLVRDISSESRIASE